MILFLLPTWSMKRIDVRFLLLLEFSLKIQKQDLLNQLKLIIVDFKIKTIVLGLPLNMDGEDSIQTKKVREFKSVLSIFNLPIKLEDERLSSVSAKKSLVMQDIKTGHNKSEIDKRAAAIILQQFLDKK